MNIQKVLELDDEEFTKLAILIFLKEGGATEEDITTGVEKLSEIRGVATILEMIFDGSVSITGVVNDDITLGLP